MIKRFCEIILKLDQWFRRRCLLTIFVIWSSDGPFGLGSRAICSIYVEGIFRTFLWNHFEFGPMVKEERSFKVNLI